MSTVKISLCIPTMDRFDTFLQDSLDKYIEFLKEGLIEEIVICDENGNDFEKINQKYSEIINDGVKLRVYKNVKRLGVFLNKIKVCKMASNDTIALIDSDNFADEKYFKVALEYLKNCTLPEYFIMTPSKGLPHDGMDFSRHSNKIISKESIRNCMIQVSGPGQIWDIPFMWNDNFISLLNMGNYMISKKTVRDINFDSTILEKSTSCDVMYFNMLAFKQLHGFQFHIVENLEYDHRVHEDSIQLLTKDDCNGTLWDYLVPEYFYNIV